MQKVSNFEPKVWFWAQVGNLAWVSYTALFSCFEIHFGLPRRYVCVLARALQGNSSRDIIKWFKTIQNTQQHLTVMLYRANHAKSSEIWAKSWILNSGGDLAGSGTHPFQPPFQPFWDTFRPPPTVFFCFTSCGLGKFIQWHYKIILNHLEHTTTPNRDARPSEPCKKLWEMNQSTVVGEPTVFATQLTRKWFRLDFSSTKKENIFKNMFFPTCTLRFKPVNRRDFTAVHGARNAGNGYYSPDFATGSITKIDFSNIFLFNWDTSTLKIT